MGCRAVPTPSTAYHCSSHYDIMILLNHDSSHISSWPEKARALETVAERLVLAPYVPARALVVGVHARAHLRVPLLVHIVQGLFAMDWQQRPTRGAQQTMAFQLLFRDQLCAVHALLPLDDVVVVFLVLVRGTTISLPERIGGERVAGGDIQNQLDLCGGRVVEGGGGI